MANRGARWWLSGLLGSFEDLRSPGERRAFLVSTAVMVEEAELFLRRRRRSLTPLESLAADWAQRCRSSDPTWKPPI